MKQCSEEMKKYFQLWLSCANGFKDTLPFVDRLGLCGNIEHFAKEDCLYVSLTIELKQILKDQYSTCVYPFGGCDVYSNERLGTMHKNPERIAFVKQFLE